VGYDPDNDITLICGRPDPDGAVSAQPSDEETRGQAVVGEDV
jgi:hypothetical protein